MQKMDLRDSLMDYLKLKNKPALYLSGVSSSDDIDGYSVFDDNLKAYTAPFLLAPEDISIVFDGGIIFCDTLDEVFELYYQVVGDDGPTKYNSYNGPLKMYAAVYDEAGECLTENT